MKSSAESGLTHDFSFPNEGVGVDLPQFMGVLGMRQGYLPGRCLGNKNARERDIFFPMGVFVFHGTERPVEIIGDIEALRCVCEQDIAHVEEYQRENPTLVVLSLGRAHIFLHQ